MQKADFYFGEVEDYGSEQIVISDGVYTSTYEESFHYDYYGEVYGRLSETNLEYLGRTIYEVSDIGRNANKFYQLVMRGDDIGAMAYLLSRGNRFIGSGGNDYLMSFDGADAVFARAGNDVVFGGRGDDRIDGGNGTDKLHGDGGSDFLIGGFGADEFVYRDTAESTREMHDTIRDFGAGRDVINFKTIDADEDVRGNQEFEFIRDDRFSGAAGEIRAIENAHSTLVLGDTDGDRVADLAVRVAGATSIGSGDLIL
jgi:Ca2+-binding RTX toxin-like protein